MDESEVGKSKPAQFSLMALLVLLGIAPVIIAATMGAFGDDLQRVVLRLVFKAAAVFSICMVGGLLWVALNWLRGVDRAE